MKFDYAIGNPPYEDSTSESTRKPPLYHYLVNEAYKVADKVLLVTPSRFLFGAGQTPKDWNEKMLNDEHFKVVTYFPDGKELFKNTNITGGIVFTFYDHTQAFGKIGIFVPFPELKSVLHKVEAKCDTFLDSIISSQGVYRFTDAFFEMFCAKYDADVGGTGRKIISKYFERFPDVFHEIVNNPDEYVFLHGLVDSDRDGRYVLRSAIVDNPYIDTYNVLVPEANGSGAIGEVLSTSLVGQPLVGQPLVGHTDTFISIGTFSSEVEAESCMKYVKTKFARAMLGIFKITQHNAASTWRRVPLQDFTDASDIDWTKPVADIDRQLYAKYGLDDVEIAFIESHVKEMG